MANMVLLVIQLAVTVVVGIYFFRQLRQQKRAQPASRRESSREYGASAAECAAHIFH